jgi:hypothetical protein
LGRSCSTQLILLRMFEPQSGKELNSQPKTTTKFSMSNFHNIVPATLLLSLPPIPDNAYELPQKYETFRLMYTFHIFISRNQQL